MVVGSCDPEGSTNEPGPLVTSLSDFVTGETLEDRQGDGVRVGAVGVGLGLRGCLSIPNHQVLDLNLLDSSFGCSSWNSTGRDKESSSCTEEDVG